MTDSTALDVADAQGRLLPALAFKWLSTTDTSARKPYLDKITKILRAWGGS
jgi:hypothetical protein